MPPRIQKHLAFGTMALLAIIAIATLHSSMLDLTFIGIALAFALPVVAILTSMVSVQRFTHSGWIGVGQAVLFSGMISCGTVFIAAGASELVGVFRLHFISGTMYTLFLVALPPINLIWVIGVLALRYSLRRSLI